MNTNLNSAIPAARGISGEGWAAVLGVVGSAVLLAKKLLSGKPPKVEHISRAEFYAETLATRERLNATHLALLEKIEANHREVLSAFERQGERLARLEGRMKCGLRNADCGMGKVKPQECGVRNADCGI